MGAILAVQECPMPGTRLETLDASKLRVARRKALEAAETASTAGVNELQRMDKPFSRQSSSLLFAEADIGIGLFVCLVWLACVPSVWMALATTTVNGPIVLHPTPSALHEWLAFATLALLGFRLVLGVPRKRRPPGRPANPLPEPPIDRYPDAHAEWARRTTPVSSFSLAMNQQRLALADAMCRTHHGVPKRATESALVDEDDAMKYPPVDAPGITSAAVESVVILGDGASALALSAYLRWTHGVSALVLTSRVPLNSDQRNEKDGAKNIGMLSASHAAGQGIAGAWRTRFEEHRLRSPPERCELPFVPLPDTAPARLSALDYAEYLELYALLTAARIEYGCVVQAIDRNLAAMKPRASLSFAGDSVESASPPPPNFKIRVQSSRDSRDCAASTEEGDAADRYAVTNKVETKRDGKGLHQRRGASAPERAHLKSKSVAQPGAPSLGLLGNRHSRTISAICVVECVGDGPDGGAVDGGHPVHTPSTNLLMDEAAVSSYGGRVVHATTLREMSSFRGKRVLVLDWNSDEGCNVARCLWERDARPTLLASTSEPTLPVPHWAIRAADAMASRYGWCELLSPVPQILAALFVHGAAIVEWHGALHRVAPGLGASCLGRCIALASALMRWACSGRMSQLLAQPIADAGTVELVVKGFVRVKQARVTKLAANGKGSRAIEFSDGTVQDFDAIVVAGGPGLRESAGAIPALNGLPDMECFWRFRPKDFEALQTQCVGSDNCAAHLAARIAHRVHAPRAAQLSMASMVFYCPLKIGDTHFFVGVWVFCGIAVWCARSGLATAVLHLAVEFVGERGCIVLICTLLVALVRCLLRVSGPSLC